MTPVFCCGAECGVTGGHYNVNGTVTISTATVRSGSRSFRANPTADAAPSHYFQSIDLTSANIHVIRCYVRFATLPNTDSRLVGMNGSAGVVLFNASDNKIYPGYLNGGVFNFGSSGYTVTTGQWYRLDIRFNASSNPLLVDLSVDGTSLTQVSFATASASSVRLLYGVIGDGSANITADVFFDDIVITNTTGDFPIGAGRVEHFVPTADGTHNVAGANDFERSATGTDITNATTTAYQLIDDVPLKSGTPTEYINLIAPPNATDYVEVVFGPAPGISTPTAAPRAVEAIVSVAAATTTGNNLRIALNDNGSLDDIRNATVGSTTCVYSRKHYADPPSAASAWTLSGNGNFNNVRMRCYTSDAAPDPWWASAMIEAEFAQADPTIPNKIIQVKQAVNRASTY
jgi:hypothetical protein